MKKRYISALFSFLFCFHLNAKDIAVCQEYFYIEEAERSEKESFLEQILKEDPKNVDCMLKLSSIYFRNGKEGNAFDLIRRAYVLKPRYVEGKKISRVLDTAIKLSRMKEIAIKNQDKELWSELGDSYFEMAIFKEASKAYTNSLKIDENQTKVQILLALSYANIDKTYSAVSELKKVIKIDDDNFYANYYLGKVLKNEISDQKEGLKYLTKAHMILKSLDPKDYFENQEEFLYLQNDLKTELGEK